MLPASTTTIARPVRRNVIRGADDPETLLTELGREGFKGDRTKMLTDDLWLYGWDVLRGLLRDGRILKVAVGHSHRSLSSEHRRLLHESSETRDQLSIDTLLRAVPLFVRLLEKGSWRADGGASLETYFTGTCASAFWTLYPRWAADHDARLRTSVLELDPHDKHERAADLVLDQRAALKVILATAGDTERAICGQLLLDQSHAAVGDFLGISARAVEGRVRRLRARARTLVEQGRLDATMLPLQACAETS